MVKRGIWAERENVPVTAEQIFDAQQENVENYKNWENHTKKQLDEEVEDDLDLEDDTFMQQYQQQRLQEMKMESEKHRFHFGMLDINKQDYEAHTKNMPEGTMGVVFLYSEQVKECLILKEILKELAAKIPTRKFMQAIATKVVENYRDEDTPALLFYKDNEMVNQIAGQKARDIFGGLHMNIHTVSYVLSKEYGFLDMNFDDDPRDSLKTFNAYIHKSKKFLGKDEDASGSDGEDDREYMNN